MRDWAIKGYRELRVRGSGTWRIGQFWETQYIYTLRDFHCTGPVPFKLLTILKPRGIFLAL